MVPFSGPEKIVCTFEEDTCLFEDDLALKERWIIVTSTVRKWDNTLNVGMYVTVHYVYMYLCIIHVFFRL